jgi:uncharacterized damage-inducible protein DinB
MTQTPWFQRSFPPITDDGLMPAIIERLDGTAARLRHKLSDPSIIFAPSKDGLWSIKKEVGHLIDLEPLWYGRMVQIINGEKELIVADLANTRTHETDHDSIEIHDLIDHFNLERKKLVAVLKNISDDALNHAGIHPRLGTPMKAIDLAYFVAEHDDHHMAKITELMTG